MREGRHQAGVARQRRLLEVGGLQTLVRRGSLGGVVPERGSVPHAVQGTAQYIHEQEVKEAEAGCGEPGKLVLEVVIRLLLQCELL